MVLKLCAGLLRWCAPGSRTSMSPQPRIGEHLEAALEAASATAHVLGTFLASLLYRELGIVLHRLSCREAAIACYEDGLKAVVQRIGVWEDTHRHDGLRGRVSSRPWQTSLCTPGRRWRRVR